MSEDACLSDLPMELISEILIRLPVKSVFRFRCVSKGCDFIVSNARLFLSRASLSWLILSRFPQLTEGFTTLNKVNHPEVSTLSVNPREMAADLTTNPDRSKYPIAILQSSNGLLLLSAEVDQEPQKDPTLISWQSIEDTLNVGNPITGEWVRLPKPSNPINMVASVAFITRVDPETELVVKFLVAEYQPVMGLNYAQLLCFSSDIRKWVVKPATYPLDMPWWRSEGSFEFEGRLFFVDLSNGLMKWDTADPFVDLEGENAKVEAVCRFIALPEGRCKFPNTPGVLERCISKGGGVIQFLEVFNEGNVLKVWRLDYDYERWNFKYNVSLENVLKNLHGKKAKNVMPMPCFSHPFDANVAYLETGEFIFSVNVKTGEVVSCGSFENHELVKPFVIPHWPSPLPRPLYVTYVREQGTAHFKRQDFVEAIKYYSKSIDLLPSAVAYANRAMAYLKVQSYREAENDCSEALKLDDKYFKVYARRAKARKELGNLEGSMGDVEFALKLQPGNQQMMNEYGELKSLLEKASVGENVDGHGGPAADVHMKIGG